MMDGDFLSPALPQHKAVVYVRQSPQAQVDLNTEGRRRQYELVELVEVARRHGFKSVDVICDDLGCSASGRAPGPASRSWSQLVVRDVYPSGRNLRGWNAVTVSWRRMIPSVTV